MSWLGRVVGRLDIMAELVAYLWARKLWWLIPMVLVLLACGLLIAWAEGSALAPFIYTLF